MSKTWARSLASSSSKRSTSSVARPPSCSTCATNWFRGLKRPLPLPWAKTTTAVAPPGTIRVPRMRFFPVSIATSLLIVIAWRAPFAFVGPVFMPSTAQDETDLFVERLGKVAVPESNRAEVLWCKQAHAFVGDREKLGARRDGADRHGDDDSRWILSTQSRNRGTHTR